MSTSPVSRVISRLVTGSPAFNTLNLPPSVPILFQRSPGFPNGDVRGIDGLEFQVLIAGAVVQSGRTGADGKIDVRVPPGGTSTLQLMNGGAVVAEYSVTVDTGALAPVAQIDGQQQRLRLLGYQVGHTGADGNGVDNAQNINFERSILDFQADTEGVPPQLVPDANVVAAVTTALTTQAGG